MTPKIEAFLNDHDTETPFLVVDLDVVEENFRKLRHALPSADIYYAVKANPAKPVLERLALLDSCFDAASIYEIEECLAAGGLAENISYGNTLKKIGDIQKAFEKGVRLFAFDSEAELEKLAEAAPGSSVFCRIITCNGGADWPLSKKFGCEIDMARDLLLKARDLGLDPYGISFHVGSQQTDPAQWDIAISRAAMVFTDLKELGLELKMLNLGGGFPTTYTEGVKDLDDFGLQIHRAMSRHFGNNIPKTIIEPGRSVVASAGVIQSEVVLVSRKSYTDNRRWVYLDVGMFGGMAETMDEAIRFKFTTNKDNGPMGPVAIAGPTCDGMDILYEKTQYEMPLDLVAGDKVRIMATGAYTTTYSSVGFNGFPPLQDYYI